RVAEDTSNKQHPWRSGSALAQIGAAQKRQTPSALSQQPPPNAIGPKTVVESKPLEKNPGITDRSVDVKAVPQPVANEKKIDASPSQKKVDTSTTLSQANPTPVVAS